MKNPNELNNPVFISNHFPLLVEICKKSGHILLSQDNGFADTQKILINKDDLEAVINDLLLIEKNYQKILDEDL